jgi:ER membrane protein complex subunit 7
MKILTLAALSLAILQAAASSLTVQIPPNNILPNPQVLPPNTHATLTTLPRSATSQQQHIISAPLTHTAEFHFADLPALGASGSPESYLLDIRSKEYVFAPYRVDIAADGSVLGIWETFRGNQWDNRGMERYAKLKGQERPDVTVQAHVVARRGFYEVRPKCEYPFHRLKKSCIEY